MAKIQLLDITMLSCHFSMSSPKFKEDAPEDAPELEAGYAEKLSAPYPEEQLIELAVESGQEGTDYFSFIEGQLEDENLPFSCKFEMGFKFVVPDSEEKNYSIDDLEPTFVWLAFPYMRELIADLTGRAPIPQYFAPPLSRLPQPNEHEERPDSSSDTP